MSIHTTSSVVLFNAIIFSILQFHIAFFFNNMRYEKNICLYLISKISQFLKIIKLVLFAEYNC